MRIINETFGQCKNAAPARYNRACGQFRAVLGNGLCVSCWDIKTGGNTPVDYDSLSTTIA